MRVHHFKSHCFAHLTFSYRYALFLHIFGLMFIMWQSEFSHICVSLVKCMLLNQSFSEDDTDYVASSIFMRSLIFQPILNQTQTKYILLYNRYLSYTYTTKQSKLILTFFAHDFFLFVFSWDLLTSFETIMC